MQVKMEEVSQNINVSLITIYMNRLKIDNHIRLKRQTRR
jgi:hypothetical protein